MDLGSIFLILALFILVALFVGRPLFEHKSTSVSQEEHDISGLLAERDRLINALHELDFDYTLKKIPEEDYPLQRTTLLQRGAEVLRRLDEYQHLEQTITAEERLETEIAIRRAGLAKEQTPSRSGTPVVAGASAGNSANHRTPGDEIEALIAQRRRTLGEEAAGFCPQCGSPVHKSDKYCPRCGNLLIHP